MGEKYTKLFSLSENLYCIGSPVIISAGALSKDNQTGKVIAQLKMKNISDKVIKAARVELATFDTVGQSIGAPVPFEYLDLAVSRDEDFGQKTPISIPEAASRSFAVNIKEVIFCDNTIWSGNGAVWQPLKQQEKMENIISDKELLKQYRIKCGADAIYEVTQDRDIWICTCGGQNHKTEAKCHKCGRKFEEVSNVDYVTLELERDLRLEEQEKMRAAQAELDNAKKKKTKKMAMIVVPFVCVFAIFLAYFIKVIVPNNKYQQAVVALEEGRYEESISILEELGEYKDCETLIETAQKELKLEPLRSAKVGDIVVFGSYEQDNNTGNGKEEIEWIVVEKDNSALCLLSLYALDGQQYNTKYVDTTWEDCSLRKWLNSSFYDAAFSADEKELVLNTNVTADKNPKYGTDQGNDTLDKVYLMSYDEAKKYSRNVRCSATNYAISRGAHFDASFNHEGYWLRTIGVSQAGATKAHYDGTVQSWGELCNEKQGVRPVIWVDPDIK